MDYVIRNGFVGNCALWWAQGRCGYTCDLNKAHRFTKEEAISICSDKDRQDVMYTLKEVSFIAEMHVSVEQLFKLEREM